MLLFFIFLIRVTSMHAQEVLNSTLLRADKLYIKRQYAKAVVYYVNYLKEFPGEYYASRQAALCYDRLNDPNNAIDYWPVVVESSEATESDYLAYGKSLLANNREPEAKKVFLFLSRSQNASVASWGKAYLNPVFSAEDTAGARVTELINFNSTFSECCPVIFRDKLFYLLDPLPGARNYKAMDKLLTHNIRLSIPRDSLHFLPSLLFEKIQALSIHDQFCFSPDGEWLYFTQAFSNNELHVRSPVPFFRYQIMMLKMSTLHNVVPEIVSFEFNQPEFNFLHPNISHDGRQLFFASDCRGSMGGMDIYVCEKKDNRWSEPKNAGAEINSIGNEVYPHLSFEGVLYFSSDQRPGMGGLDLFYSGAATDSTTLFQAARNCGSPINSRFVDFGIFLLTGGHSGYLSSKRKENRDEDLYYFSVRK